MTLPSASISFLDADSKAILNGINLRLNDIDLKLSIVLELLATRLPGPMNAALPTPTENGALLNTLAANLATGNLFSTLANSTFGQNLMSPTQNQTQTKFADSLTARLLAACQERQDPLHDQIPKNVPPLLKAESSESMIWNSPSEHPSPSVGDIHSAFAASILQASQASPSTSAQIQNENADTTNKSCGGSAESKEFTDDGEYGDEDEEIKEEYEDEYGNESNANTPVTLIKQGMGLASPGVDEASTSASGNVANVEGRFPEGAVKRAAEKAARSFQSTQPKVFAWQILRESITDDELKNIQISLRTFHGETAAHLLQRQLPKIRLVVESTMSFFKWDQLTDEVQLAKAKLLLSHLKNNAKVRNWTLREGRPNSVSISRRRTTSKTSLSSSRKLRRSGKQHGGRDTDIGSRMSDRWLSSPRLRVDPIRSFDVTDGTGTGSETGQFNWAVVRSTNQNVDVLWKRYAALLGPGGLAAVGLLPGHQTAATRDS